VQINNVDLSVFSFNFDFSWAVFFLNSDLTVYGRYGTRSNQSPESHVTVPSMVNAMKRVLELHRNYPKNKKEFAGKKLLRSKMKWKTPEQIPALGRFVKNRPNFKKPFPSNCIHCHQVAEAIAATSATSGQPVPDEVIWPYPLPEAIGINIDRNHGTKVESLVRKGLAAKSRLKPGDIILSINGQTIISIADIQWVLHHTKDRSTLKIKVQRSGKEKELSLKLKGKWRKTENSWGGVGRNKILPRANIQPVPDAEKRRLGISSKRMALRIVNAWPRTQKAGFKDGDIFIRIDNKSNNMSLLDLIVYLGKKCVRKKALPVIILRKDSSGKYKQIKMTLQLDPNYLG